MQRRISTGHRLALARGRALAVGPQESQRVKVDMTKKVDGLLTVGADAPVWEVAPGSHPG